MPVMRRRLFLPILPLGPSQAGRTPVRSDAEAENDYSRRRALPSTELVPQKAKMNTAGHLYDRDAVLMGIGSVEVIRRAVCRFVGDTDDAAGKLGAASRCFSLLDD